MRVISGKHRNRKIQTLEGLQTRPPLEMFRAAYFNRVGKSIVGKTFLDCFAGSGSMGIEALSRGSSHCTFIEANRKCSKLLQANLDDLHEENGDILCKKLSDAIQVLKRKDIQFDFIFADPPFDQMMKGFHLHLSDELAPLLNKNGRLAIRYPEKSPFVELKGPLHELDAKKYGLSLLRQFVYPETDEESTC